MWIYEVRSNVQVQVKLSLVLYSAAQQRRYDRSIPLQGLSLSLPVIDMLKNQLRCRLGRILPANALDEIIIGICISLAVFT